MKLQIVSDLHLEFGTTTIHNEGNTDVLVLSGDICVAHELRDRDSYNVLGENYKSNLYHTFFQECCERFPHIIYVMGNHEHYHGDFAKSYDHLKEKLGYLKNLYILEKEVKVIDDVTFVAGTLWTNMNKEDPITIGKIKGYMNDYRIIEDSNEMVTFSYPELSEDGIPIPGSKVFHQRPSKFSPEKSIIEHKGMMNLVHETLASIQPGSKVVIVGHHAPSKLSTKPRYQFDFIVNGAYSSDLSDLILDNPCIKLWTHGHTHSSFDYMLGSTRIVCNPRGYYNYEENDEFDSGKVVEI